MGEDSSCSCYRAKVKSTSSLRLELKTWSSTGVGQEKFRASVLTKFVKQLQTKVVDKSYEEKLWTKVVNKGCDQKLWKKCLTKITN